MAEQLEIERKFLVEQTPGDLWEFSWQAIRQGYLVIGSDSSEARLRDRENIHTITVKTKGDLVRGEWETPINNEQFDTLWPATEGKRIEKTRFSIPYLQNIVELDVYSGQLEGLITAEVEFMSEQQASSFIAPGWFGLEVTDDKRYKNQNLAIFGAP